MKLNELLWGTEDAGFVWQLVLRSTVMFTIMLVVLQVTGKRGVKQLSIFEMIMIIALGSAAGDPMLYKDVGLLSALIVFGVVILIYRAMVWLITKSEKAELFLEGKPEYVIRDGRATDDNLNNEKLGIDEFFSELRSMHIEHLGQVKSVMIETNGLISVLHYNDDEVKYGLPIWPEKFYNRTENPKAGTYYSCSNCGFTELKTESSTSVCGCCKNNTWVESINTIRIT